MCRQSEAPPAESPSRFAARQPARQAQESEEFNAPPGVAIRKLREQGKREEADREWDGFREAYPDYAVAESDLARK